MGIPKRPGLSRGSLLIPGVIKERHEDFVVEEIPAYEPGGQGDHVYFGIEKRGISTMRAVRKIAGALGVKPSGIGIAGMKDARGITRQMMSLEHVDPDSVLALDLPGIRVLWVKRHRNKLKIGHLRGNRFVIRVRNTEPERIDQVKDLLRELHERGVPNYFGPQRFGLRGDTWEVGRALILGDFEKAVKLVCGSPRGSDGGEELNARRLFEEGNLEESAAAWPRGLSDNARLCKVLSRRPDEPGRAIMASDKRMLRLYASAYQSYLFNRIVAERIDRLDVMEVGDLAWKHDKGVVFTVDDEDAENLRASRLEISPSGPLYGKKMSWPSGEAGVREKALLVEEGLSVEDFPGSGPLKCTGGRRPLRFIFTDPHARTGEDEHGEYIEMSFTLPAGCYATVLLAEIFED